MIGLDHDRRDVLAQFSYFNNPDFEGPQPVDEDADGDLLNQAIRQHLGNFRQTDFMAEFRFREEGLPYDPEFSFRLDQPLFGRSRHQARCRHSLGVGLARRRGLHEWRHLALPDQKGQSAPSPARPLGSWRAHRYLTLAARSRTGFSATRRSAPFLRYLSDGPRHWSARRGADPLFCHPRRRMARGAKLASDRDANAGFPGERKSPRECRAAGRRRRISRRLHDRHRRRYPLRAHRRYRQPRLLCGLAGPHREDAKLHVGAAHRRLQSLPVMASPISGSRAASAISRCSSI